LPVDELEFGPVLEPELLLVFVLELGLLVAVAAIAVAV
jgi:hypothetical protein